MVGKGWAGTALLVVASLVFGPGAAKTVHAATCASSVGPSIPPPAGLPAGVAGFHAQWYGQSGYPTLCPGDRNTATVAYFNSGSFGWVNGRLGEVAYLGTWGPEPGQDQASPLGGDGALGSPSTGWPRYNRIAVQPAPYVGPGQVAWFQFTIQAPLIPGTYRLYLRPLVEGATWMEDFGVFWLVTVLNPDGTPPAPPPVTGLGYSLKTVNTPVGQFQAHVVKERLADVTVRTVTANAVDCFSACPAKPLDQYAAENGGYAAIHGSYFCPPDYAPCAAQVNSFEYAVYNTALAKWLNPRALISNSLFTFTGRTPHFYPRSGTYDRSAVSAGISNYPALLAAGAVVDSTAQQSPTQMQRATRGAIGVDGTYIYLAILPSASVTETAYVMQSLGARDALNLDGGGSAALWIAGSFKVGPGRQLPNAIVLTKP